MFCFVSWSYVAKHFAAETTVYICYLGDPAVNVCILLLLVSLFQYVHNIWLALQTPHIPNFFSDPRGFIKCSSLVQSLLDTLTSIWSRRRSTAASLYANDLIASELLIQSITQVYHRERAWRVGGCVKSVPVQYRGLRITKILTVLHKYSCAMYVYKQNLTNRRSGFTIRSKLFT